MDIEIIEDIIHAIVKELQSFRYEQTKYAGVTLWSKDDTIRQQLVDNEFIDMLKLELDNEKLDGFTRNIVVSLAEPAINSKRILRKTPHGEFYVYLNNLLPSITAVIGVLDTSKYSLDWTVKNKWIIGRGKMPSPRYNVFTPNDIVISENVSDQVILQKHQRVSSFHASITYNEEKFYLSSESGGEGHTTIVRSNQEMLLGTGMSMPLNDGDYIKLGSANNYVLLQFKLC